MTDSMLIWSALCASKDQLETYLKDAPLHEKTNLNRLFNLIEQAQNSLLKALSNYSELISSINQWYEQLDLEHVNNTHALTLLQSINDVLRALETDCKNIIWPLSLNIPSNLYNDIEQLLKKANAKENLLLEAVQCDKKNTLAPSPPSTLDKLNHLLNDGIQTLMTKRSALAENKDAHILLIEQFKQLTHCFSKSSSEPMLLFWQQYSEPERFDSLMTLLLVPLEEKNAWLYSHSYYRMDKIKNISLINAVKQGVSSLYALSAHSILGAKLTSESLNQRIEQSIEQFYQKIIETHQQNEDKDSWLTQIEDTITGAKIDPLLHELMMLQRIINTPLSNHDFSFEHQSEQIQTLSKKADVTSQAHAMNIKALRTNLINLHTSIKDAQKTLKTRNQAYQMFLSHVESIEKISKRQAFPLTNLDSTELVAIAKQISDELKQNFFDRLPPSIACKVSKNDVLAFQECEKFLIDRYQETKEILVLFNHKGDGERQQALKQLGKFIKGKHSVWEYLLRFFSSAYRHCMANVEAILRNTDENSLDKVDNITKQFQSTANETSYFIRQRVTLFAGSHCYGMFMPEDGAEKTPDLDIHSLAF